MFMFSFFLSCWVVSGKNTNCHSYILSTSWIICATSDMVIDSSVILVNDDALWSSTKGDCTFRSMLGQSMPLSRCLMVLTNHPFTIINVVIFVWLMKFIPSVCST